VLAASEIALLTRTSDTDQLAALRAGAVARRVAHLSLGEALLVGTCDEAAGRPTAFRIAPRLTTHVRHRQKYLDVPVAERHAFVFTRLNHPFGERAHTLTEFSQALADCPPDVLAGHLERGDISRWVSGVFGDYVLAARIRAVEQLHRLGQPLDRVDALGQLVDERYALLIAA
jgi:hypothetical protein